MIASHVTLDWTESTAAAGDRIARDRRHVTLDWTESTAAAGDRIARDRRHMTLDWTESTAAPTHFAHETVATDMHMYQYVSVCSVDSNKACAHTTLDQIYQHG